MRQMNLGLAIRVVLLFLTIILGVRLLTPITWSILLLTVTVLVVVDTLADFRLRNPGRVQKLLGVTVLVLACAFLGATAIRFWRNRNWLLRSAVQGGYEHVLRWSLSHGADANAADSTETPLMLAVIHHRPAAVRLLVEAGADANRPGRYGRLPVVQAAGTGYTDVLQELFNVGAKLNLASRDGGTALNEAADFGQTAAVRFLLEHGGLVDQRGEAGRTALIDGAVHPDIVRALLAAHASVNVQSNDGVTALMIAAGRDVPESVELLLKAGADPTIKDREGRTALDVAKQYGAVKAIPLLVH